MSTGFNQRNAFSHSSQCDVLLSIPDPAPGGVEHTRCLCWCHGLDNEPTYNVIDPGYDLSPPPEYANSADIYEPDPEIEAEHNRARYKDREPEIFSNDPPPDYELENELPQPAAYPNRSRQELIRGVCDNCGDALAKCECVE